MTFKDNKCPRPNTDGTASFKLLAVTVMPLNQGLRLRTCPALKWIWPKGSVLLKVTSPRLSTATSDVASRICAGLIVPRRDAYCLVLVPCG
jgi:hypothetical protein